MHSHCPKCDKVLLSITVNAIEAKVSARTTWNAVEYQCPYCRALLGVGVDPIALKNDTVTQTVEKLVKLLRR